MASLENRTGFFNIVFRFRGRKFTRSLKTDDPGEAERRLANLEQTIRDVDSGRIELPSDADIPTFLLSDGKLTHAAPLATDAPSEADESPVVPTLGKLFSEFFDALPEHAIESSSLATMRTHERHLLRLIGAETSTDSVDLNTLDRYVKHRAREKGTRNRNIGATTIKKELSTLRRIWTWARKRSKVFQDLPSISDVQLPKTSEIPPFQTWEEIEQQISDGKLSEDAKKELWDCLYLDMARIDQLLKFVEENARQDFLYPMIVMAAHTGAGRSELMRSELSDIRTGYVIIREKKRNHRQMTTRRVPTSSLLEKAIEEWRAVHPGGKLTFCLHQVSRSKKGRNAPQGLTRDEANDHFQRTLKGSKWEVIRGWHCLRHSFISNLASRGIDQRLIDEFVGHSTEEMRRRYRHLFPDIKATAIKSVFG